jgi:hypothetical protein
MLKKYSKQEKVLFYILYENIASIDYLQLQNDHLQILSKKSS